MIRLSPDAQTDLRRIGNYIGDRSGWLAAENVIQGITRTFRNIDAFPGLARTGRVPNTRELPVRRLPYILIYRAENDTITILRIIHAAQLWPPI